ncbi:hypothetical protein IB265_34845 [Ensifer sp. ENS10]|uniref:Rap1a/Tai family immunity protein n=1 Tax=Ensifer sp. ENS10 TaxID=2769286 RepID=UPI0017868FA5|nr:Rap1a/Tai family immunity protein [Ensifer sp. ENS10]MBD9511930.1 hypothetical protein [Ensifer sp. ENS10]
MRRFTFTMAILMSASVHTQALALNGQDLSDMCRSDRFASMMYVKGAADGMFAMGAEFISCIPNEASTQQMGDVVCKWLRDNPQHRHKKSISVVGLAFKQAWPCG